MNADPYDECCEQVGRNSVWYAKCQKKVHRRCLDEPSRVSLLLLRDLFNCRTCLSHNCSVKEKTEVKNGEDVSEELEKFCYFGNMFSYYGGAPEAVSERTGSA